ncbi:hypothetical protein DFP73DRAFT_542740 [Morchella snyderi]|nr:hypothetical protein DFP73DRAFT_542740 [Morchella snyderi]
MKLQTVLLLLASVVSVHSQFEAPMLSNCLDIVINEDATDPNFQNCQKCITKVEKECLPATELQGNNTELLQNLEVNDAILCGENKCIQAIADAANAAAKRDVEKRCRGRLCGN